MTAKKLTNTAQGPSTSKAYLVKTENDCQGCRWRAFGWKRCHCDDVLPWRVALCIATFLAAKKQEDA